MSKIGFGTVRRQRHKNNDKILKNILEKILELKNSILEVEYHRLGPIAHRSAII